MIYVLLYMIIYNITSFVLFITLFQLLTSKLNSLYSFTTLDSTNPLTKILSVVLLSLAGVPPLLGFFSKVFILTLLTNSRVFILLAPFLVLLFVGLYFYIQNLRFLNSSSSGHTVYSQDLSLRTPIIYFSFSLPLLFLILFGFAYVDDLLIVVEWLLL